MCLNCGWKPCVSEAEVLRLDLENLAQADAKRMLGRKAQRMAERVGAIKAAILEAEHIDPLQVDELERIEEQVRNWNVEE
jgi:hypothetical protein